MIAIVDYGVGNLFSLSSSLNFIGAGCKLTGNAGEIASADKVILPGVGAFGDAAKKLRETGLDQAVIHAAKSGKPLLGICLGMQLLFDKSEEYGEHKGLSLIPGEVKSLAAALPENSGLKVPHIGWNSIVTQKDSQILKNTQEGDCFYYVHSFYVPKGEYTAAYSEYGGVEISGAVQKGNIFGTQFHPEKSGEKGLKMLLAFTEVM